MQTEIPRWRSGRQARATTLMLAAAVLCAATLADLSIATKTPWAELERMLRGVLSPTLPGMRTVLDALLQTLAFAVLAVAAAAVCGLGLALAFDLRVVRTFCAAVRAVHELFWGLLFLQVLGLHPLAGLLAIAIPYAGTFAKVYAEMIDEQRGQQRVWTPAGTDRMSLFLFADWPALRASLWNYTLYRFECGLRSSTVLGFIGVPTLGFHLESALMQGDYAQTAGLLLVLYALIGLLPVWGRRRVLFAALPLAAWYLFAGTAPELRITPGLLADFVPAPLRTGADASSWLRHVLFDQAAPGILATLVVTVVATALGGAIALAAFPLLSSHFSGTPVRIAGHLLLVVLRSTPELLICFVLVILWGPSMLPAVVALAIHNGAIIGHLLGRISESCRLRPDAVSGVARYAFEIVPRAYGQFLAFLLYRAEIILRETAILGVVGVATLGFYVDSAFSEFRLDVALVLVACAAVLNVCLDAASRKLRHRMRLRASGQDVRAGAVLAGA